MENTEPSRELLENVSINDVGPAQYNNMMQRIGVENPQLLSSELLQHHNGLVVDLGAGDFIPVNYTSDDLLTQDLTEEDRNLAAALVAVQLSQQQKQQQLQQDSGVIINSPLPSLVTNNGLDATKVGLSDQQLILTDKAAAALNGGYLQIVGHDGLYVDKQALPKLLDSRFESGQQPFDTKIEVKLAKIEDEEAENCNAHRDSDGENKCDNRTSKKSLPHKKRISRKLKKSYPALRKINKCNLCEQTFISSEEFSRHQNLCQTTITPIHASAFSCQLCNAPFSDQLSFFEHLKAHYEPIVEVEEQDTPELATPKTETVQDQQKESLLSSLLNNIHCVQCNKTFKRQKTYEAHVREVHNKMELNEFSEPEDLMAGIDVVVDQNGQNSDDDSKAWLCRYRDDELHATEADLREFEAQEHVCHICKQPFPIRAILLQHLVSCRASAENADKVENVVTKKKGRKKTEELACTECDRVFTHRNSLVYHMRSHTGDRPHQCDQCGKSFFAASALKVHLRLHTGDKPYRCEECGRNFRQWGDLKYHCISIHSDEKEYQCEYCGKDFARKYSLIVHRRIHTGEKNYKCEFCQKTFRASSYLQNHRRIHTGEKPHVCEICQKPFRVRSDMKRHLKTHGRRRVAPKSSHNYSPDSPTSEIIITKVEDADGSEGASESSNGTRNARESESENAVSALQFEQDPLENVRDGNTLYTNGHQLFICYPGEAIRNVESTSTWIQTD